MALRVQAQIAQLQAGRPCRSADDLVSMVACSFTLPNHSSFHPLLKLHNSWKVPIPAGHLLIHGQALHCQLAIEEQSATLPGAVLQAAILVAVDLNGVTAYGGKTFLANASTDHLRSLGFCPMHTRSVTASMRQATHTCVHTTYVDSQSSWLRTMLQPSTT